MKPISLKVENCDSQTGVVGNPRISWKYGVGNHIQTAYEILLFNGKKQVYSTGKVESNVQHNVKLEVSLEEQRKYTYQVLAWDEQNNRYESEMAPFITGVHSWQGKWIGKGKAKPCLLRKSFAWDGLDEVILSVCVPGQFEILLNGKKISPYVYEGCQTNFHKHVHYSTYELNGYLVRGENVLTIEVANGWYIGDDADGKRYFYTMDKGYEPFGDMLSALVQLRIGEGYIVSDEAWEVAESQTTLANIYGNEDVDFTKELRWESAIEVCGPKGEIIPMNYPGIVEREVYEPRLVDAKRGIYDFGQNMSAQFEISLRGIRGQKVQITPAEKLNAEGDIEKTVDTYCELTLSGNVDVYRLRFSVHGARWYKVEGIDLSDVVSFKAYFVTSGAKRVGSFTCSDERINKIYSLVENAIDSNLNHLHTDCPTIEKLGWLEPNHLMGRSIMYLKEVDNLWSKIAMDMRDSQYETGEFDIDNGAFPHRYEEGLIPSIAPRYARFITDWHEGSFWDIIPWGSSIILAAYEQYLFYGNTKVLKDNYDSACKYIEYLSRQYDSYNEIYDKKGTAKFICAGLGDWGIEQNQGRSRENIETAVYYYDLVVMAKISMLIESGEENRFFQKAVEVKENYNRELLCVEGDKAYYRSYDGSQLSQANQALPLYFGMVPEEYRKTVENTFVGLCEGQPIRSGEIGQSYIYRALAMIGRNDIIMDMLLREQHPSYYRFVTQGETTLPEFWRDDARSRNHDMLGHIMEWFFTEVAGIKSDDGFQTVSVEPKCTSFLPEFTCTYESVRGAITVSYTPAEGLQYRLPNNVSSMEEVAI